MADRSRLTVSNLAWTPHLEDQALALLARRGIRGVEVAPTRIAPWPDLNASRLGTYRRHLADHGLVVSSLQAVLFGIDGAELLRAGSAFTCFDAHMRRVAEIGAELSAGVIVFGAPRSRLLNGLDRAEAMKRAVERLSGLVPALRAAGLVLGIEPVPQYYGGEFLTCAEQVATLVERIGDPAIRLHLDTGCAHLGGDAIDLIIARFHPLLAHFHAAEPDLAGFGQPLPTHAVAAAALDRVGYGGWISIEMKPQAPDPIQALDQAIGFVRPLYGTG